jgi:hypothetical protein
MIRSTILPTLLLLLFAGATAFSQEKEPQRGESNVTAPDATKQTDSGTERFIDTDGDGIDDAKQRPDENASMEGEKRRRRERARDRFIDADGDGINDNRCGGVGVSKGTNKGRRWGRR